MVFNDRRFYRLTGPSSATTPTAGDEVDGVAVAKTGESGHHVFFGVGKRVPVEAGGSFSSDTPLATDANGRAVRATSGDVRVARALESSGGVGSVVRAVLTAQREM